MLPDRGHRLCEPHVQRGRLAEKQTTAPAPASGKKGMIQLNLPPETELKTLIDLVSQRLGVQFLYDEQVANKRISINSPRSIPAESLLEVLEVRLKMKGLALVDAEPAGWKRIVVAEDLPQISVSEPGQSIEHARRHRRCD